MHIVSLLSVLIPVALATAAHASEPCPAPHIQAHLEAVERELLAADTSHLSPEQRARRAHHIEVLGDYRERCEFPDNRSHIDRLVTIFVDDEGVRCAVGHLMAEDGRGEMVERIRATRNTATVWDLAGDAEVAGWLERAGFSLYEAARIQPSYCFMNRGGTCLCGGEFQQGDVIGVAEGAIVSASGDNGTSEVAVEVVHGSGAVVGETRTTSYLEGDVVGRRALVVIRRTESAGDLAFRGADPLGDGEVQCTSGYASDPKYCAQVSQVLYVEALLAEDCMAHIVAEHAELGTSVCDLGGAACGAVPGGEPEAAENVAEPVPDAAPGEDVQGGGCVGGALAGWALLGLVGRAAMAASHRSR